MIAHEQVPGEKIKLLMQQIFNLRIDSIKLSFNIKS